MRKFDEMKLVGGVITGMIVDTVLGDRKKPVTAPKPKDDAQATTEKDDAAHSAEIPIHLSDNAIKWFNKFARANSGRDHLEFMAKVEFNSKTGEVRLSTLMRKEAPDSDAVILTGTVVYPEIEGMPMLFLHEANCNMVRL